MMRIVLDANVLVSAVLSPDGTPARILEAWRAEQFDVVISDAIVEEIDRVLYYPKIIRRHRWSEEHMQHFLDDLAHLAVVTPGQLTLAVLANDPPDIRYLACTVEGDAADIASGDEDLLQLGIYQGIRIITPRQFLDLLREQPQGS
jgi:hypothetical protein